METPKLTKIAEKAKELGIKPDEINIHSTSLKGGLLKPKAKTTK